MTITKAMVAKLYLATFGRPLDSQGLEYWTNTGAYSDGSGTSIVNMEGLSASFAVQTEYQEMYPQGTLTTDFVSSVYANLLGREADADGLAYWVDRIDGTNNSGTNPDLIVDAKDSFILTFILGAQDNENGNDLTLINNRADISLFLAEQGNLTEDLAQESALIDIVMSVDGDSDIGAVSQAKVAAQETFVELAKIGTLLTDNVFTLHENTEAVTTTSTTEYSAVSDTLVTPSNPVTYWGDAATGEGVPFTDVSGYMAFTAIDGFAEDPGFLAELLDQIKAITEKGVIDLTQNTGSTTTITATNAADGSVVVDSTSSESTGDYTGDYQVVLNIEGADVLATQITLTSDQFEFFNNMLFDANGNSRLFEKVATTTTVKNYVLSYVDGELQIDNDTTSSTYGLPLYVEATSAALAEAMDGAITTVTTTTDVTTPIILTPTVNNGYTEEYPDLSFTSDADDLIVAGRLDFLHGAYIDGGAGVNTLEIDAKGYFAQPKELLNIQTVNIENLPNIYTDATDGSNNYPTLDEAGAGLYTPSIIDLSRAIDIENLTITEGGYAGLVEHTETSAGMLTVTGVRADAVLTLKGDFSQNVTVDYSEGLSVGDAGTNLVLRLGDTSDATFNILQNSATINIDSQGGGNAIDASFGTSSLMNMNISGDSRLEISSDLATQFQANTPAVIDASANTAGVDLLLGGQSGASTTVETTTTTNVVAGHVAGSDTDAVDTVTTVTEVITTTQFGIVVDTQTTVTETSAAFVSSDADSSSTSTTTVNETSDRIFTDDVKFIGSTGEDNEDHFDTIATGTVTVSVNDGDNDLNVESTLDSVSISSGNGANQIHAHAQKDINIVSGEGANEIRTNALEDITIEVGSGDNQIEATSTGSTDLDNEDVVTIAATDGNNDITASSTDAFIITAGNGDNRIEAKGDTNNSSLYANATDGDTSTITVGDGQNEIDVTDAYNLDIETGVGVNEIDAVALNMIKIDAGISGDASNVINASAGAVTVTTGNGDNTVSLDTLNATVTTGTGNDTISAKTDVDADKTTATANIDASEGNNTITVDGYDNVTVIAGSGDDSLTILGGDIDMGSVDNELNSSLLNEQGRETMITVDLGTGANTLTLGRDSETSNVNTQAITAVDGSTITGENIALKIDSNTDLSLATISGVTSVELTNADDLTLTVSQFEAMVAEGVDFSVYGDSFGGHSVINLIVDASVSLDNLSIDDMPRSIDFKFQVKDDVTLTLTAEQLHERVTDGGITAFADNNGDFASGSVMITDAGVHFDAFDTSLYGSIDEAADQFLNVYLDAGINGYERPVDNQTFTRVQINTDEDLTNGVLNPFDTNQTFLRITGDSGLDFQAVAAGVDEWGTPIANAGDSIQLGGGVDAFKVDFSSVVGDVTGLTLDSFENVAAIYGNDARVDVKIAGDVAEDYHNPTTTDGTGLVSRGVSTFVVVDVNAGTETVDTHTSGIISDVDTINLTINGIVYSAETDTNVSMNDTLKALANEAAEGSHLDVSVTSDDRIVVKTISAATVEVETVTDSNSAVGVTVTETSNTTTNDTDHTFWTCSTTEGLETLGLQGLNGETVTFGNTKSSVDFLVETEYVKDSGYVAGTLVAEFDRTDTNAVVNVVAVDAVPSDDQQVIDGIKTDNARSLTVNVTGGETTITTIVDDKNSDTLKALTLSADDNVTITTALVDGLDTVDASGIAGNFTVSTAAAGTEDFMFTGSAGTTTLTMTDTLTASADSAFASAGTLNLVTSSDGATTVDLTKADVSGISSILVGDADTLKLTVSQANQITPEMITGEANATTTAKLILSDLNEEKFVKADYDLLNLDFTTLDVIDQDEVTLHAETDLTGINTLNVVAGNTLNLTGAQFQQLKGDAPAAIVGDQITVNVTDYTQADEDLDLTSPTNGADGFDATGVSGTDAVVTLTIAEDVVFQAGALAGVDTLVIPEGMTATVATFKDLDGLTIEGGANSVVAITAAEGYMVDSGNDDSNGNDIYVNQGVDASNWDISEVLFTNTAASGGINVDEDLFINLPQTIEKTIINSEGEVTQVTQTVTVEAGTSVDGDFIAFNKAGADQETVEISEFTMNMDGGTHIAGNLELSTDDKLNSNGHHLLTHGLQTVTINSTGTDANLFNAELANVISGNITPFTNDTTNELDNTLTNVVINADQEFMVGGIIFNSWSESNDGQNGSNDESDDWTINDNESATATVTVTGIADVDLGNLNSADDEVDAMVVNNTGTGAVTATIDANLIDAADALSFTGSNIALTVKGTVDLSNDDLSAVTQITIAEDADLTLSQVQIDTLIPANIINGTINTASTADETLAIVELSTAFDATAFAEGIDITTITMAAGTNTLVGNFTDVDSIIVPEGGVLNLTAEQFQQLLGNGTITGVDSTTNYTVNITNLMESDLVNADMTTNSFVTTGILADNVTVSLAEDVNLTADDVIENVTSVILTDGQTLGLADSVQADGLKVDGTGDTTVVFNFLSLTGEVNSNGDVVYANATDTAAQMQIDASGYTITSLRTIDQFYTYTADDTATTVDELVDTENAEYVIENLSQDTTLYVFDSQEFGYVEPVDRVVVIESGAALDGEFVFNDIQGTRELVSLDITMEGNATITNDLRIPTVTPTADPATDGYGASVTPVAQYFGTLDITSTGTETNTIGGITANNTGINTDPASAIEQENNLLDVNITADADLVIGTPATTDSSATGIVFSSINDAATANLDVNTAADTTVTIYDINTQDNDVDALTVTQTGAGALSVGINATNIDVTDALTINGSADVTATTTLVITGAVNLSDDMLTNVDSVVLTNGADLILTQAQIDAIGMANIIVDDVDTSVATLNVVDLGENVFDSSLLTEDVSLGTVTVVDDATVTLNGATNLSGVDLITISDTTTLNMTAAQFIQTGLTGTDKITQTNTDSDNTTNGTVNITGLMQDDEVTSTNTDAVIDFTVINAAIQGTLTLAEDNVALDDTTVLEDMAIQLADGQTITLNTFAQANARTITGTATSTVKLDFETTATSSNTTIDTAGYSGFGSLFVYDQLVEDSNNNIEDLLLNLTQDIDVYIYDIPADAMGNSAQVERNVTIVEGTDVGVITIFNDYTADVEVTKLKVTMDGDASITGGINLGTVATTSTTTQSYFDTLTIISQGDAKNTITGTINGAATVSNPNDPLVTETVNNLDNVVVTAMQDLDLPAITFTSVDDTEATAKISVDVAVDKVVNIANLISIDTDVDALAVTQTGDGALTFGLNTANIDVTDDLTLTGSATGTTTVEITGAIDLSDNNGVDVNGVSNGNDTLTNIDTVTIAYNSTLTLTTTQYNAIGAFDGAGTNSNIVIEDYNGEAINLIPDGDDVNITLDIADTNATVVLDTTSLDLSQVTNIVVPEGTTLQMTADQFESMAAAPVITGAGTLNIVEFDSANGDIDVSGVDAVHGNIELLDSEALVTVNVDAVLDTPTKEVFTATFTVNSDADIVSFDGIDVTLDATNTSVNATVADYVAKYNADFDTNWTAVASNDSSGIVTFTAQVAQARTDIVDTDFVVTSGGNATTTVVDTVTTTTDGVKSFSFVMTANDQVLVLSAEDDADARVIDSGAFTGTELLLGFTTSSTGDGSMEASGWDVANVRLIDTYITNMAASGDYNYEERLIDLDGNVDIIIDNSTVAGLDPAALPSLTRDVFVREGASVTAENLFDDNAESTPDDFTAVKFLNLTMEGDTTLTGDVDVPTDNSLAGQIYLETLTITSTTATDKTNTITGNIMAGTAGTISSGTHTENISENILTDVNIQADADLVIGNYGANGHIDGGDIYFTAAEDSQKATLDIEGSANVTMHGVVLTDYDDADANGAVSTIGDIGELTITNNAGTLTMTGGTAAVAGTGAEALVLSGLGDMVFGNNDETPSGNASSGIQSTTLSLINASTLAGSLDLDTITVDDANFTFIAGTGETTLTIDDQLDANMSVDPVVDTGWTFDMSNATGSSELHLMNMVTNSTDAGSPLNINLGDNTTLYIDETMDLSSLDLSITQTTTDIVVKDGTTLTLTAAQADALKIVAGDDIGNNGFTGTVNIVDLGDNTGAVDFSGIASDIAGTIHLTTGDTDVTVDAGTDLGDFSVTLVDLNTAGTDIPLAGQVVRFNTEDQAARAIITTENDSGSNVDTSVVWLFTALADPAVPVNTDGYSSALGRVWLNPTLANGANIESLFTNLDDSILRVEFSDLTELDAALASSQGFDRTVELVAFTDLPNGLNFSDENLLTNVHDLTIEMGGDVTVGNIMLDNVIDLTTTNPLTNDGTVTINSKLMNDASHYLAPVDFVDGTDALPTHVNVVGDIGVGAGGDGSIDLLTVDVNTGVAGDVDENGVTIGRVVFDSNSAAATANFNVTGDQVITVESLDTTDADISTLTVDATDYAGTLTVTGGSPAAAVANTEILNINMDGETAAHIVFGSPDTSDGIGEYAGVSGAALSEINIDGNVGDRVDFGVVAQVDSDLFQVSAYNDVVATMTLGLANVDGVDLAPTLNAGGDWKIYLGSQADSVLTITGDVNFGAGSLILDATSIQVSGDVDFESLTSLTTGNIEVLAGATLHMTAAQADGMTITGAGDVIIDGLESDLGAADGYQTADLSGIMTSNGDTGSVTANVNLDNAVDASNPANGTIDPVVLSDDLGIATVNVTGTGSVSVTGDMSDTVIDGVTHSVVFTVDTNSVLNLTTAQANDRATSGLGETHVIDLNAATGTALNLGGLTTTTVTASNIAGDTTLSFGANLGAAVVTLFNNHNLTADIATLDAHTVAYDETVGAASTGSELIVKNGDANPVGGDLSNVTVRDITLDSSSEFNAITYPVLATDTIDGTDYPQSVEGLSTQLDDATITGTGNVTVNGVGDNDSDGDDAVDFDLSGIVVADPDGNANPDNLVFNVARVDDNAHTTTLASTADFGTFDVIVPSAETLILSAAQADGLDITGDGATLVTALEATPDADLSGIATTGGEEAQLDANGGVMLSANLGTDMKVTVTDSVGGADTVTFNGTLNPDGTGLDTTFDIAADDLTLVFDANDANLLTVTDNNPAVATPEVVDLAFTGDMTGGTISLTVGGATITQDFDTNEATTLTALANTVQTAMGASSYAISGDTITFTGDASGAAMQAIANVDVSGATGYTAGTSEIMTDGVEPHSTVIVNNIDSDLVDFSHIDALTLTGNVPADTTLDPASDLGNFDLSLAEGVDLGMTTAQLLAVGEADITGTAGGVDETLIVSNYDGEAVNSTALGHDVTIQSLTVLDTNADVSVDSAADFTNVQDIVIPDGTTLTMTADQFEALPGNGTVTGGGTLDLTNFDSDNSDIDLSGVTANLGTITLDSADTDGIVLDPAADLSTASIVMTADSQSITFSSETQADGRVVTDPSNHSDTTVILGFTSADATDADANIESSGFTDVDNVWVINEYIQNEFGGSVNFENMLPNLDDGVVVTVYDADTILNENLGSPAAITSINRHVVIDSDTTLTSDVAFNDLHTDIAVGTLQLDLQGNSVIVGDLTLPQNVDPQSNVDPVTLVPVNQPTYFTSLTINSTDETSGTAENKIDGNIFADDGTNGAGSESEVETFTVVLDAATSIVGTEDSIGFDGAVVDLANDDDVDAVGTKLAAATYSNYTATYDEATDTVTYTNMNVGSVPDITLADFTMNLNGAGSTVGTPVVTTTTQGIFNADENNLYLVNINADHDLNITGDLEMSYVTRSVADDETVGAVINVTGAGDVNIGSVNTDDEDITSVTLNNLGAGAVTAPGTSPGAALGNTEALFINSTDAASSVTLGGDATDLNHPGVAGADLSLIEITGAGDVNLGVISSVDGVAPVAPAIASFLFDATAATGTVTATLGGDALGNTPTLQAGGVWTFNGDTAGVNTVLTIDDSVTIGAGVLNFSDLDLVFDGTVDMSAATTITYTGTTLEVAAGADLTLTALQASGLTITGAGTVHITDLEATPAADLGGIMTSIGDTGTVDATLDATGGVILTGDLGIAHVTVSGTGVVDATAATIVPVDRADTADTSDDIVPSFTVGTGATVNLTASQVGNATGTSTTSWKMLADGAGAVAVGDLALNADADLSGLTTPTVTAVTNTVTFTGVLGTGVVVTLNDSQTMEAEYNILTGNTVNHDGSENGQALVVDIPTADAAADLSTITSDITDITADFTGTQTFTGNLDGHNANISDGVTVTTSADRIDGLAITDTATGNIVVTDLATNLAADLSGISLAGTETAAFDASGTFTGNLGSVDVTIADGVTMTAAAHILAGAEVNKSSAAGNGAVAVTVGAADAAVDLTTLINGTAGTDADITSITVTENVTFTGTLHTTVATGVNDGVTLSTTAAIANGKTINATGTTGAVAIDASVDADFTLQGSADFTATGLVADLTANAVSGDLDVTVAADANINVDLGSGANSIDADALQDGQTLSLEDTLFNETGATVTTVDGNINASAVTNNDTDKTTGGLTLTGGDGTNVITGSANNDIINGGIDADTLSGGAGDDTFIVDATFDVVAGESIDGGTGVDTIAINTANAIDLSLATLTDVNILDLTNAVTDVTLTGAQLNGIGIINADATDNLTIDTLNSLTVTATDAIDTFDFVTGGAATNVTINAFNSASTDVLDLDETVVTGTGITAGNFLLQGNVDNTATALVSGLTVIDNNDGTNVNANSLSTADVAAYLADTDGAGSGTDAIVFSNSDNVAYIAVSDGTDTGIYLADDINGDTTIDSGDLTLVATLIGIPDAGTLTAADFTDFA